MLTLGQHADHDEYVCIEFFFVEICLQIATISRAPVDTFILPY